MKVIITEPIVSKGVELLEQAGCQVICANNIARDELLETIQEFDGMIVRSYTMVDDELLSRAKCLKVVGRAGNGIDNIDLDSATRHGVIVTNNPDGNSVSAAEHTIGLILAQCRNIPQAAAHMREGGWKKKQFEGIELYGKTVGIVGLGRIGTLVAQRLQGFGCRVIAYDPYIAAERFEKIGAEPKEHLAELLQEAQILTVHTPRTDETYGMIGAAEFAMMPDGVRVVNCARGGIIDEDALYDALLDGKVASAALDVFNVEPVHGHKLFTLPQVVMTAHMGAATVEAQETLGVSIAQQVLYAMKGEMVTNAVNLPSLPTRELAALRPYAQLAEQMGKVYFQLQPGRIREVEVIASGELSQRDTRMLTLAFLKGMLEVILKERVNYVNAPILADNMGIRVIDGREGQAGDYPNLLKVRIGSDRGEASLAGTVFGRQDARIVEIMDYKVDISPSRYMLFIENMDQPGVIGAVGTLLGHHRINIASMQVGRRQEGRDALMILNVDNPVGKEEQQAIAALPGINAVKFIRLS
jgi:D-3-phosphoglycerate dehydrogenase / 2-oxoglutarate reductase